MMDDSPVITGIVCATGRDLRSGGFLRESDDWMAIPRISDLGDGGGYEIPRGPGDLLIKMRPLRSTLSH